MKKILKLKLILLMILSFHGYRSQQEINASKKSEKTKYVKIDYPEIILPPTDSLAVSIFYDSKHNVRFYKDKYHVYTTFLKVLDGLDPKSFEIHGIHLIKDKDHFYYEDYPHGYFVNELIDAKTAVSYVAEIDEWETRILLKDRNHLYEFIESDYPKPTFNMIEDVDVESFHQWSGKIFGDKDGLFNFSGLYFRSQFSDLPPPQDNDLLNPALSVYAKLPKVIYKPGLKHLKHNIYTDGYSVFSLDSGTTFENADPESFIVINEEYAKDKNIIYYKYFIIDDRDNETFKLLPFYSKSGSFSRDKNNIYWDIYTLENVDKESFEVLSSDYAKDKNKVYYHSEKISRADAKSFLVLKDIKGNPAIAVDKRHMFFEGKVRKDVDPESITDVISAKTWLDNDNRNYLSYEEHLQSYELIKCPRIKGTGVPTNHHYILNEKVYYSYGNGYCVGIEIPEADVKTFIAINEYYSKDKNYVYYKGKPITQFMYKGADGKYHSCTEKGYASAQKLNEKEFTPDDVYSVLEFFGSVEKRPRNSHDDISIKETTKIIKDMYKAETTTYVLNPKHVQFLGGDHGKDDKYFFSGEEIYVTRSVNSTKFDFVTMNSIGKSEHLFKDKNHVYDGSFKILDNIDQETLVPLYYEEKRQPK